MIIIRSRRKRKKKRIGERRPMTMWLGCIFRFMVSVHDCSCIFTWFFLSLCFSVCFASSVLFYWKGSIDRSIVCLVLSSLPFLLCFSVCFSWRRSKGSILTSFCSLFVSVLVDSSWRRSRVSILPSLNLSCLFWMRSNSSA